MPTAANVAKMRAGFAELNPEGAPYFERGHPDMRHDYEHRRAHFEREREALEPLRRPFALTPRHAWGDVWSFPIVRGDDRHPCEKPLGMLRQIVEVSSRPGDLVLDPFGGSFALAEVCKRLGRRYIGTDLDEGWVEHGRRRLAELAPELPLGELDQVPEQSGLF